MENNEQIRQAMMPVIASSVAAAVIKVYGSTDDKTQIIEDTVEITKRILDKLYA